MPGFIVMLGMVGSGKSLQSHLLAERRNWQILSTGELLRESSDGAVRRVLQKGELLDDVSLYHTLIPRLGLYKKTDTIILDGFPRRMSQVLWLEAYGKEHTLPVLCALHLQVDASISAHRLQARARDDDTPAGIANRNKEYQEEIMPVISYYRHQKLLIDINANLPVEDVSLEIDQNLVDRV